jgi:hypothetical protein
MTSVRPARLERKSCRTFRSGISPPAASSAIGDCISGANPKANAAPIPYEAPVMIATLSFSLMMFCFGLVLLLGKEDILPEDYLMSDDPIWFSILMLIALETGLIPPIDVGKLLMLTHHRVSRRAGWRAGERDGGLQRGTDPCLRKLPSRCARQPLFLSPRGAGGSRGRNLLPCIRFLSRVAPSK